MIEDDAAALLGVVRRTRGQTRSRLAELSWLPWVLYGVLSLIAVPMTWRFSPAFSVAAGLSIFAVVQRNVEAVGIGSRRSSRRTQ